MEAEGGSRLELESLLAAAHVSKDQIDTINRLLSDIEAGKTRSESYLVNLLEGALSPILKSSMVSELTEYTRTVHAEMAAITDAAQRGVPTARCNLYSTTFPCHECTRHIIVAGVDRVVYVEPYPKSYAKEQHGDAIVVDSRLKENHKIRFEPFVGVAPRQYMSLFALDGTKRKNEDGSVKLWSKHEATPSFQEPAISYLNRETDLNADFNRTLVRMGLIEEETKEEKDAKSRMAETATREKREGIQ
jgi:cytidine deaminase